MAKPSKPVRTTATLETHGNGNGWHFIKVSRKTGERLPSDGKSRRVVCTLNGKESFQCALMLSQGDFYILVNKRIRTALGAVEGDILKVTLEPDTSKYGLPMPEEFKEVLNQDTEGNELFHALTPGKQRSLIYTVSSAKDVDIRIHRALIVMEHLKKNDGKVIGEKLYHELKRPLM